MIEDFEIIYKRCIDMRFGDPVIKHDLPFDPGACKFGHEFEINLSLSYETPAQHQISIKHAWAAFNQQGFELINFGVESTFGFVTTRPLLKKSEISRSLLIEFVHASISHSRALLANFVAKNGLSHVASIEFVDDELIAPLIDETIDQVSI